jgi:hypothetical protein
MMRKWILVLGGSMLLAVASCGKSVETEDQAAAPPPPTPASPGAAPTYGTPSGMGFSTGDAANTDGQGSGMMGYNGTGKMGTSGAISDKHEVPPPPASTTQPVLPAP